LVIDIVYENKSGAKARYRKDAAIQTMAAARTEERNILARIAQYGEPTEATASIESDSCFAFLLAYRGGSRRRSCSAIRQFVHVLRTFTRAEQCDAMMMCASVLPHLGKRVPSA
jgi:hypothetical protein